MHTVATGRRQRIPLRVGLLVLGTAIAFAGGCVQRPPSRPVVASRGEIPAPAQTEPVVAQTMATSEPAPATEPIVTSEPAASMPGTTEPLTTAPAEAIPPVHRRTITEQEVAPPPPGMVIPAVEPELTYPRFSIVGTYMYGPAGGQSQIPSGGHAGTSTGHRPRFREIGIDDANIFDGEFSIAFDPNQEIFGGAQIIQLSGGARLGTALISHSVHFPRGTFVNGHEHLDWYRLGYRYTFVLDTADNGRPQVTLAPWIEAIFWDFDYALDGGKVGKATRSFTKPGAQIGGTLAWRPNGGPLSFEASLGSFPQLSSLIQISNEQLVARYRFYQWRQVDLTLSVGVGWEQQFFRDAQFLANHITADFGPMLIAGLDARF